MLNGVEEKFLEVQNYKNCAADFPLDSFNVECRGKKIAWATDIDITIWLLSVNIVDNVLSNYLPYINVLQRLWFIFLSWLGGNILFLNAIAFDVSELFYKLRLNTNCIGRNVLVKKKYHKNQLKRVVYNLIGLLLS